MDQLPITYLSLITKRSLIFFFKNLENSNKNNQQITKPTTVQLQIDRVIIIIIWSYNEDLKKKKCEKNKGENTKLTQTIFTQYRK